MKRLAIALGIALVAATALFVFLLDASRAERQLGSELEARIVALQSAPGAADTTGAMSSATGASRPAVAAGAAPDAGASSGFDSMAAAYDQLLTSPEGREFNRAMLRMSMDQQYPDAARELGLSQVELDKLFDLLANRMADEQAGRRAGSSTPDGVPREQGEPDYEREIQTLLADRYPRWQQYQQTLGERRAENWKRVAEAQLRSAISAADRPVDDAQFQALQAALTAEEARFNQEVRAQPGLQQAMQRMSALNRRLVDVASVHLDAVQLERYRRHLQQQEEMVRLTMGAAGAAASRVESD